MRVKRIASRAREPLAATEAAVRPGHNLFVPVLDVVKDAAILGVISDVYNPVLGAYRSAGNSWR